MASPVIAASGGSRMTDHDWMTTKEVAPWLRVPVQSIYRLIAGQGFPTYGVGVQYRFKSSPPGHRSALPRDQRRYGGDVVSVGLSAGGDSRLPPARLAAYLRLASRHQSFNLRTIQQLPGRKDLRMTAGYSHLLAERPQQAVNRYDMVVEERPGATGRQEPSS
jgi:excisionase family DNA binding protein